MSKYVGPNLHSVTNHLCDLGQIIFALGFSFSYSKWRTLLDLNSLKGHSVQFMVLRRYLRQEIDEDFSKISKIILAVELCCGWLHQKELSTEVSQNWPWVVIILEKSQRGCFVLTGFSDHIILYCGLF